MREVLGVFSSTVLIHRLWDEGATCSRTLSRDWVSRWWMFSDTEWLTLSTQSGDISAMELMKWVCYDDLKSCTYQLDKWQKLQQPSGFKLPLPFGRMLLSLQHVPHQTPDCTPE